jgi:hypothetical protein
VPDTGAEFRARFFVAHPLRGYQERRGYNADRPVTG